MRDVANELNPYPEAPNSSAESPSHLTPQTISLAAGLLLNCIVADAASTLSQGQKQLLCVARILLGLAHFIFFDRI